MNRYMQTVRSEYKTYIFWRDVGVEVLATFLLMSVQCSLPLSWSLSGNEAAVFGSIVQTGLGMGFVVCALAWTFGDFGGCHMNPAVSFSMVLAMKLSFVKDQRHLRPLVDWNVTIGVVGAVAGICYVIAQCLGAMAGAGFLYVVTPAKERETLAATQLNPELEPWQGMLVEMWLTFILVCTVQGATNKRRKGEVYMPTIVIGGAVIVGVLSGSAHTGASMNPARSLGPAVVMGLWSNHWIYWVGPFLGGALSILVYNYILDKTSIQEAPAPFDAETSSYIISKDNQKPFDLENGMLKANKEIEQIESQDNVELGVK